MKNLFKWIGILVVLGCFGLTAAMAADVVQMATSEDLNAFDSQLTVHDAAPEQGKKGADRGNGLGAVISAEARKMKETGMNGSFGQFVRTKAMGHGNGSSAVRSMSTERVGNPGRDQAASVSHGKKDKK